MLRALRIESFAVIEQSELTFEPGLTVLTGETGAGKSMLVDALGLVLGGRADPESIRAGADEAVVEAILSPAAQVRERLAALGLPDLGDELSVRRTIGRAGKGKVHINGALATVGVLARLMRGSIDVAGQHEHVGLFDPSLHVELLDRCGRHDARRAGYAEVFGRIRSIETRRAELGGDETHWRQRLELLRFQLDELERLDVRAGEEDALELERRRLSGTERLREGVGRAEALLESDEGAALERSGMAHAQLSEAAKLDTGLTALVEACATARAVLQDVAADLRRYASGLSGDPRRLTDVEDRLDALRRCAKRHGVSVTGLVDKRAALALELGQMEQREVVLAQLSMEEAQTREALGRVGQALTQARTQAAKKLEREIAGAMAELALSKAKLAFRIQPASAPRADGLDDIEIAFSANPGEPLRPIAKACSGGEASRVMLALKAIVTESDPSGTSVLDEADAGVSGAVAESVGRLIHQVSRQRQVLCITHLPQVAAFADAHVRVEKIERAGRVRSRLISLETPEDRTHELARMLAGAEVTREAIGAAQALVRSVRAGPSSRRRPGDSTRGRSGSAPQSVG